MSPTRRTSERDAGTGDERPALLVSPKSYLFPLKVQVFGNRWPPCPIYLYVDDAKEAIRPALVLLGETHGDGLKPARGEFHVLLNIPGLQPGQHVVRAVGRAREETVEARAAFVVEDVPEVEDDGRPTYRWLRRQEDFLVRRFPDLVDRLPGSRLRALEHRDGLRERQRGTGGDDTGPPVDPGCNWYGIGPSVVRNGQVFSTTPTTFTQAHIAGRVTSLAIDPHDPDVLYAGAAQGGVWKSEDGGLNWRPKSDYAVSLAIGCVSVDPSVVVAGRSTRILAGTGEPNQSDSYYGAGMLFSSDGGDTWTARGTATFVRAAFSTIAVDPANNHHLYAATDIGVFESIDEGVNWTLRESGVCYDLVVDWSNVGGAELYVGKAGVGVRRSQNSGASWTTLGGGLPASAGRIALAMAPSDASVLYAAFSAGSAGFGGLTGIFKTVDGGNSWTATSAPAGVAQADYNLALGVHPTDPNTVLFGEVHLWRSTNGGGAWTRVSTGSPGIHADQHDVAFHPTNGNVVYVGNDGGVFSSSDGGVTWVHRNKDLATLQYFGVFGHAQWDGVMLGGSQDNGAHRYTGHPAWEHSALGDAAFGAINSTTDPHRWFETRWYSFPCFRNDSSGTAGSWVAKQSGIVTNNNWFYPPLEMDPNNSTVLYCGYDHLYRTSNSADSWASVTGAPLFAGVNISAIAVAPSDSNTVFVGLRNGRVYRLTFSGGSWTATNLTNGVLPAGQISDIAIHPTNPGIVYVTTSNLIFSEGAGESFTQDHVYKTINGGTSWTSASSGLSQDNPVNTIVIDPNSPNTLFVGCDVGVFRTDNGGMAWFAWDDGLPNCSVQDLKLFNPGRLLRAATHGRSVWERPIDSSTCPLSDVYLRDDVVDTGRTTPSPSGVEHPYVTGDYVYWWQSVDIKVDSPDLMTNTYQTSGTDIDYVTFEGLTHDNPRRDTFVRAYVQVHNRGNVPATNVQVRAFWANASAGLPPLPADFWTAFPNTDPADTTNWHPVGTARTIASLYPGQPGVVEWTWLVPGDAPDHSCMLAVVRSDQDPVSTTSTDVGTAVNGDNNVTLKNLHVDDFIPGAGGSGLAPYYIDFDLGRAKQLFDIRINAATLPAGALVHFFFPPFEIEKEPVGLQHQEVDGVEIPPRADEACGPATPYDPKVRYTLAVKRGQGRERPGLYGIVPRGSKFSAAIFVELPKRTAPGAYRFHLEQWVGNVLVGGSSYELRVAATQPERRARAPRR